MARIQLCAETSQARRWDLRGLFPAECGAIALPRSRPSQLRLITTLLLPKTCIMTVREMIKAIGVEVRTGDLEPHRAAELLTELSALLANVLEEIREADAAYAEVLLRCYHTEEKANRAKLVAETSPEHRRKQEARDTKVVVESLMGSLKYLLRSYEAAMKLT